MGQYAAFFDLDRTLIAGSSATIYQRHMIEAGLGTGGATDAIAPLLSLFQRSYDLFGESWTMMQIAKAGGRAAAGWKVSTVDKAAKAAAEEVVENLQPFAQSVFDEHRAQGARLVLATTSPEPWMRPLADALGFDDVISTRWVESGGAYTGELDGPFIWGPEKAKAVRRYCNENGLLLKECYAYSDSYFDSPLLDSVGHPVAVNPDPRLTATATVNGWPIRHLDKAEGVAKVGPWEIQELARPLMRPELVAPYVDIEFEGVENIPSSGPVLLVFNHRSYFDPTAMGLLAAKAGRSIRGLGKKEVFDVPVIGRILKAAGGIRVERASGSDEPLLAAAEALKGGELVMMAPQGTIPRGPAFFDPVLKGRWGAARLAELSGAPVIPVGLWGTEHVWPRSARFPQISMSDRPKVSVNVGGPVKLGLTDPDADTAAIMEALVELLPPEAREHRTPTPEELARTYPPGYKGDPTAEVDRRPGTDT